MFPGAGRVARSFAAVGERCRLLVPTVDGCCGLMRV